MYEPNIQLSGKAKRKNQKIETSILAAATTLFANQGYNGTTTMEIARNAKISEKTLFTYFPRKQELYDQAVHYAFQLVFQPENFSSAEKASEPHHILKVYFETRIKFISANPDLLRLLSHEYFKKSNVISLWLRSNIEELFPGRTFGGDRIRSAAARSSVSRSILGVLLVYLVEKINNLDAQFDDEDEITWMIQFIECGTTSFWDSEPAVPLFLTPDPTQQPQ